MTLAAIKTLVGDESLQSEPLGPIIFVLGAGRTTASLTHRGHRKHNVPVESIVYTAQDSNTTLH